MTYQVLARKWRPKHFTQLLGQSSVSKALTYALSTNRLHHAYLFTGTRGVGKTTMARLLAKSLNCELAVQAEPCGTCSACVEIHEGCFPDVIEVDAASRTRIEDTKELLDNVLYAPLRGRYKIYLIDEVHMLSGHSFNALLKTLEEPPLHVKFIFATTEPERIPVTILSRCLHFNLRPIAIPELEKQLEHILCSEKISYEPKAIQLLAKAGKGSARDCLSLLEQAIGIGQGQLHTADVAEMLGLQANALMLPLMQALCAQDLSAIFSLTNQLASSGADFERVLEGLLDCFQALNMMQMVPNAKEHIQNLQEIEDDILNLHTQMTPEQTQLYYQMALTGKRDLSLMPDARRAFDMVLLRMMCFRAAPKITTQPPISIQPQVAAHPPVAPSRPLPPLDSPRQISARAALAPLRAQQQSVVENEIPNWRELISKLGLTGLLKLLAQHCIIHKWAPPEVQLVLEPSQQPFFSPEREKELSEILTRYFKQTMAVKIILEGSKANLQTSPAMQLQSEKQTKQIKAQSELDTDETVQTLIEVFDAKLMNLTLKDSE